MYPVSSNATVIGNVSITQQLLATWSQAIRDEVRKALQGQAETTLASDTNDQANYTLQPTLQVLPKATVITIRISNASTSQMDMVGSSLLTLSISTSVITNEFQKQARDISTIIIQNMQNVNAPALPTKATPPLAKGKVRFSLADGPANLTMDKQLHCEGKATCEVKLPKGPHIISLHRAGYEDTTLVIAYPNGSNQYTMQLRSLGNRNMATVPAKCRIIDTPQGPEESECTNGFFMDTTEVTQDDFASVTGRKPSIFAQCGPTCPVENVTWFEANTYCQTLGKRLPSARDWEYAAQAEAREIVYTKDTSAWASSNIQVGPVASFGTNAWGLQGMYGNVWEWTADGDSSTWEVRGDGGHSVAPTTHRRDLGFRCASLESKTKLQRAVTMGDMLSGLICGGGSISTKSKGTISTPTEADLRISPQPSPRPSSEIMQVLRARFPGLRHVYNKYLKLRPGFAGKILLTLTIAPSGEIIATKLDSSITGYDEFDEEIRDAVSRWRFKVKPETTGNVAVTVPFLFLE